MPPRAGSTARDPPLYTLLLVGLLIAGSLAYGQDRNTETRFREGMTAIGEAMCLPEGDACTARLDEAIAAFRSFLITQPELVCVRSAVIIRRDGGMLGRPSDLRAASPSRRTVALPTALTPQSARWCLDCTASAHRM